MVLFTLPVWAQVVNGTEDKLAERFGKSDYEWVLKKAEGLMSNDKTRKDPEGYMWASMCHLQLSRSEDEKIRNNYRNGLREALKLAAKSASKDKEGSFIADQSEYLTELKKEGVAMAQAHLAEEDHRKANYLFKQMMMFAPEDQNIVLAKGVTDLQMNNTMEGERLCAEALPRIEAKYRDLSHRPDPTSAPLLRASIIYYINHLGRSDLRDDARNASFVARIIFPLDEEVKTLAEAFN